MKNLVKNIAEPYGLTVVVKEVQWLRDLVVEMGRLGPGTYVFANLMPLRRRGKIQVDVFPSTAVYDGETIVLKDFDPSDVRDGTRIGCFYVGIFEEPSFNYVYRQNALYHFNEKIADAGSLEAVKKVAAYETGQRVSVKKATVYPPALWNIVVGLREPSLRVSDILALWDLMTRRTDAVIVDKRLVPYAFAELYPDDEDEDEDYLRIVEFDSRKILVDPGRVIVDANVFMCKGDSVSDLGVSLEFYRDGTANIYVDGNFVGSAPASEHGIALALRRLFGREATQAEEQQ